MACPICRKDTDPRYRPFCSRRCADIDLGRWLTGAYVLPGAAAGGDDDLTGDAPGGGENSGGLGHAWLDAPGNPRIEGSGTSSAAGTRMPKSRAATTFGDFVPPRGRGGKRGH